MMNHLYGRCPLCLILSLLLGCGGMPISDAQANKTPANGQSVSTPGDSESNQAEADKLYIEADRVSYNGYEIMILEKTAQVEGMKSPVSYVAVKRNNKLMAAFDRLRYPHGSFSKFGLFPVLGGDTKQLLIEQAIPRASAHWIVRLSPDFRVIFDSAKYDVGHELRALDIDEDGVYEISLTLHTFWFFDRLCGACSPWMSIYFKYDKEADEYFPANHIFPDYVLEDIDESVARVEKAKQPSNKDDYSVGMEILSTVLNVVLRYVYAGKEKEAWDFYDKEYTLPDREEMRAKIKKALEKDSIYKFIYRR